MKRDMDLIREILIDVWHSDGDGTQLPVTVMPHARLLRQSGFLKTEHEALGVYELTWQGYEFLALIQSDDIWGQIVASAEVRGLEVSERYIKAWHETNNLLTRYVKDVEGNSQQVMAQRIVARFDMEMGDGVKQKMNNKLFELARAVVKDDPVVWEDGAWQECCALWWEGEQQHTPDCAWLLLKKEVEQLDNTPQPYQIKQA